jgi:hypothetical protein
MISDIVDIVKLLQEAFTHKAELDLNYFDRFIKPIWEKFINVHNEYKKSFEEYIHLVQTEDDWIDSLTNKIRKDSIFSDDTRSEIKRMTENTPSAFPKTNKENLGRFFIALAFYFDISGYMKVNKEDHTITIGFPETRNGARFGAYIRISRKGTKVEKDEVIEILLETIKLLQSNYDWVAQEYFALRKTLLT